MCFMAADPILGLPSFVGESRALVTRGGAVRGRYSAKDDVRVAHQTKTCGVGETWVGRHLTMAHYL